MCPLFLISLCNPLALFFLFNKEVSLLNNSWTSSRKEKRRRRHWDESSFIVDDPCHRVLLYVYTTRLHSAVRTVCVCCALLIKNQENRQEALLSELFSRWNGSHVYTALSSSSPKRVLCFYRHADRHSFFCRLVHFSNHLLMALVCVYK